MFWPSRCSGWPSQPWSLGQVLSLAELWRQGQPYAARIPGATAFARTATSERSGVSDRRREVFGRPRLAYKRLSSANRRQVPAGTAFPPFGLACGPDLSRLLRLRVQPGVIAQNYLERLLHLIAGGHEGQFWVRWEPVFSWCKMPSSSRFGCASWP